MSGEHPSIFKTLYIARLQALFTKKELSTKYYKRWENLNF